MASVATADMDIIIANRERVETGLNVRRPYALISITDPDLPPIAVRSDPMLVALLRLSFDDAKPGDEPTAEGMPLRLMRIVDALKVWRFVLRQPRRHDLLVVHCEAGWSRSPAVAAAVAHGMGEDATTFFARYRPNEFVFRTMLACMPRHLRRHL